MDRQRWALVNRDDLDEREDGGGYRFLDVSAAVGLDRLRANLFRFRPGDRMEYHSHKEQEELLVILEGTATLVVEGERCAVKSGDLVRFDPPVKRQLVNDGDRDCLWLGIGAPGIDDEYEVWPQP
jgi:uncharacterized cupin superfamily protein